MYQIIHKQPPTPMFTPNPFNEICPIFGSQNWVGDFYQYYRTLNNKNFVIKTAQPTPINTAQPKVWHTLTKYTVLQYNEPSTHNDTKAFYAHSRTCLHTPS